MNCNDFEYDGYRLSDFGFIVGDINGGGQQTESNITNIEFTTASIGNGIFQPLISSKYGECVYPKFSIFKNPCKFEHDKMSISLKEIRDIHRWLSRTDYHELRLLSKEYENTYFNGSFNVDTIFLGSEAVGFELEFHSDSPYAHKDIVTEEYTIENANDTITVVDDSDEIGYTYIDMEITCNASGNLSIKNINSNYQVYIGNCSTGENITLSQPMIKTDNSSHKIQNDFNFNFPRLENTLDERINTFQVSLPCTITLSYNPTRKVGI